MKHWRKEDKVVTTDQLEYRLVRSKEFLELPCYFDSGESATQNQYLWRLFHFGIPSGLFFSWLKVYPRDPVPLRNELVRRASSLLQWFAVA
jgi:hypothetical protein